MTATRPGAFSMTPRMPTPTACSRGRFALAQRVGGIADQRKNAGIAERPETRLVGHRADLGRRVELPVAGVNDGAERRGDGQRHRLGDRMADRDRLDPERPDLERLAGLVDGHRDLWRIRLALALGFEQAGGEGRHPDRRLEARPQLVQRAVMVLMRVGDDDAAQILDLLLDEADVGQHEVDAGQRRVRKCHADIDHDPLAFARRAEAVEREVHADLADAAERHEDEFGSRMTRHIRLALTPRLRMRPRRNARRPQRSSRYRRPPV